MSALEIKKILWDHWNIEVDSVKKLVGYDDLNYRIKTVSTELLLLKIIDKDESHLWQIQNNTAKYLDKKGIVTNQFIFANAGEISVLENKTYYRLLKYVEGDFVFINDRDNSNRYKKLGSFIASLHNSLMTLNEFQSFDRVFKWDLQHIKLNLEDIDQVKDLEARRLCQYFIQQLDFQISENKYHLQKSLIHNDLNPDNILQTLEGDLAAIDLGDLCYSYLVADLAICLTYVGFDRDAPVDWMVKVLASYAKDFQLSDIEIKLLYYFIAGRMATSIISSSNDPSADEYVSKDQKSMIDLLKYWITQNPIKVSNRFLKAFDKSENLSDSTFQKKIRKEHFSNSMSIAYREPIHMSRAAFQYMYDSTGKTYVDCINNISHVGHSHPKVVEAIQKQATLLNTNTRYLYDIQYEYTKNLLKHLPAKLNKIFFVNSGSEALELATRLAKAHTQRKDFMVMDMAYHGHSNLGIDLSPYKFKRKGGYRKPKHTHILDLPFDSHKNYADQSLEILSKNKIAAFIAESISGCGGQFVYPKNYLKEVYQNTRDHGAVCIADEVQTGFGRTGYFWAFEHYDVVPDIVMMGKPMGNGHPMAAVVTTEEICTSFENGMEFFSSFGGNPVSCAVGNAVLKVIEEENLMDHARTMQDYLLTEWNKMKNQIVYINEARGLGLFLGLEIVKTKECKTPYTKLAKELKEWLKTQGFLLSTDGRFDQVIKFKPPMCFNKENADDLNAKVWEFFRSGNLKFENSGI